MATTTMTLEPLVRSAQVRIQLQARNDDIQLPRGTGPILVSTGLRRYQLSTLVNRLIETAQPIPLEFLINGQFLRTSLDEFLTQSGISTETTLNIEYVRALIPPLHVASYEHDDWLSSVDVLSASSKPVQWAGSEFDAPLHPRILSTSLNGAIQIWDSSGSVVATASASPSSVNDAKFISPSRLVTASSDRVLRLWSFSDSTKAEGSGSISLLTELYGHKSSVNRIAVHGPSTRILSASADHTVGFWSSKKSASPPAPESLLPKSATGNKRRKLSHPSKPVAQYGPLSTLVGHQAQVSSVCFDERDSTVGYSASWDHCVKTWDLTTSACVDTRTTAQALYSLEHLPDVSLLATGTSARHITLIDPRASAASVSAMTLRGHTNSISTLARDPKSTYQIVSGSHDGTCRVWDIRSVRSESSGRVADPVYVIERESAREEPRKAAGEGIKVFGVAWDADVGIVSAGEDKRVQINRGEQ